MAHDADCLLLCLCSQISGPLTLLFFLSRIEMGFWWAYKLYAHGSQFRGMQLGGLCQLERFVSPCHVLHTVVALSSSAAPHARHCFLARAAPGSRESSGCYPDSQKQGVICAEATPSSTSQVTPATPLL